MTMTSNDQIASCEELKEIPEKSKSCFLQVASKSWKVFFVNDSLLKVIPRKESKSWRCIRSPNSPRPIFPPISQNIPQYHLLCLLRGCSHPFPFLLFQEKPQSLSIVEEKVLKSETTCGKWSKDIFDKRNRCHQESGKWCGRMKYRRTTQTTVMTVLSIATIKEEEKLNGESGGRLMMHRARNAKLHLPKSIKTFDISEN